MSSAYKVFLRVATSHDYYVNGTSVDLSFVPTEQTLRLMKNYRLKFNSATGGFVLAFQSFDNTNPLIPYEGIKLDFIMQLDNIIEFFNFTNLDTNGNFTAKKKLYFTNNPQATKEITHTLLDQVRPKVFTFTSPLTTNDPENELLTLEITHEETGAQTILSDVAARPDGSYEVPVDLSKQNAGQYSFKSTTQLANDMNTLQVLIDDQLYRTPFFGMVSINLSASTLDEYELVFQRKESVWNYILVNRSNRTDFNDLLVKDNSLANSAPYQSYLFQKLGPSFTVGDKDAVKFQSTTDIPAYELPKRDIELVKEVNGNDLVLMKNLANPPLDRMSSSQSESDIYVFV